MEDPNSSDGGILENYDGEEDFRSCCAEEEGWKELEEPTPDRSGDNLDEFSMKMFFKGVSVCDAEDSTSGISGIGVVMERAPGLPTLQVQKRLDLYVEPSVADHLALLDGLLEALRVGVRRIFAFTDSEVVNSQVTENGTVEDHLLFALGKRIMEHADKLDLFSLHLVPSSELEKPLQLAQEAVGISHLLPDDNGSFEGCSICREKHSSQILKINCSHKFCSPCLITYVQGKLQASQVPVRCSHSGCQYYISSAECQSFLPIDCYESFERTLVEAEAHRLERIRCPFLSCSAWLAPTPFSVGESSSSYSNSSCIECPECSRLVCFDCGVPWHISMTCGEYQSLPQDERDEVDITMSVITQDNNWRCCEQCRRIIERTQGCYHMTCWCGHEFCYACGAEYQGGFQACRCDPWEEEYEPSGEISSGETELWRWELFDSSGTSAYTEQERSQLALIQTFLAGGLGGEAGGGRQSPPQCSDAYGDTLKDLHHLPWLERFVSVISDCYHEDCAQ